MWAGYITLEEDTLTGVQGAATSIRGAERGCTDACSVLVTTYVGLVQDLQSCCSFLSRNFLSLLGPSEFSAAVLGRVYC